MISQLNAVSPLKPFLASQKDTPEKIRQSARDFEALLIAHLLKSARGDQDVWGTGEDRTADSIIEMAEEKIAESIAISGGLGLAKMITTAIARSPVAIQNGTPADKET
jgi:Rod binding domain-containing protein